MRARLLHFTIPKQPKLNCKRALKKIQLLLASKLYFFLDIRLVGVSNQLCYLETILLPAFAAGQQNLFQFQTPRQEQRKLITNTRPVA